MSQEDPCQPGDIRITPISGGFMVGRILPRIGRGSNVQYIATASNYQIAVDLARRFASMGKGVRVFVCKTDDQCEAIPPGPHDAA